MRALKGPRPALNRECAARPAAQGSWTLYKPLGREAPENRDERQLLKEAAAFPLQRQHIGLQAAEAHFGRQTLKKISMIWQPRLTQLLISFPSEREERGREQRLQPA